MARLTESRRREGRRERAAVRTPSWPKRSVTRRDPSLQRPMTRCSAPWSRIRGRAAALLRDCLPDTVVELLDPRQPTRAGRG